MVTERYQFIEDILNNVLRMTNYDNTKKLNHQLLCEQMFWGIRRNFANEVLQLLDAGGDAYTKLSKITELIKEST